MPTQPLDTHPKFHQLTCSPLPTHIAWEMMAFVGLNIVMGITDLPEYRDYWSEDPILHDTFVASVMARRRYEKLGQYFHCSLAGEEMAGDKLAKVRPLIIILVRPQHQGLPCSRTKPLHRRGDDSLRWQVVREAVYAEKNGKVGDEAVVCMPLPDRLLPRLQRIHG